MSKENKKDIKKEKEQLLKEKQELESLIQNTIKETEIDTKKANALLKNSGITFDYSVVDKNSEQKAKSLISALVNTFVTVKLENDSGINYLTTKSDIDMMTLKSLLIQMETSDWAISKLLKEIDNGSLHPRMFEVLASLQRSKMDIVKHITQYLVIMENFYKNYNDELILLANENNSDFNNAKKLIDEPTNDKYNFDENGGFISRGSKGVIEMIDDMEDE